MGCVNSMLKYFFEFPFMVLCAYCVRNICVSVTYLTISFSNFFLLIILISKLCNKGTVQCGKLVGPADMGWLVSVCSVD
jgi:hypothetical protein